MLILLETMAEERRTATAPELLEPLMARLAGGDQEALAELYHRTRTSVYGLALSYLKNRHDAEDVTQDAFVRAWENAHQYRPQGTPLAWLLTIARNLALMKLRERGRTQDMALEDWERLAAENPMVTVEDRQVLDAALTALEHAAPDHLEALLSRCEPRRGNVIPMTVPARKPRKKAAMAWLAAACLALVVVGGGAGVQYYQANAVASVISLDVNPSVELDVNRQEKVVSAVPLNADANEILDGMDLKGADLNVAVNAIMGSLLKHGYVDELANSILISVEDDDAVRGAALEQKLTTEIGQVLDSAKVNGAILSQTLSGDSALQQKADEYGISLGKATLIQSLVDSSNHLTFESLVGLSINELNLLANSTAVQTPDSAGGQTSTTASNPALNSVGTASQSAYIGVEAAKEAALTHAGVTSGDVVFLEADYDYEDGRMVYEVEFFAGNTEYEYDVDAATGAIVKHGREQKGGSLTGGGSTVQTDIGEAAAKAAAFAHAGVAEGDVRGLTVKRDFDDGRLTYELEFWAGTTEYEYEIAAADGSVLKSKREEHSNALPADQAIGRDAARDAALAHAGVALTDTYELEVEEELDERTPCYKVEFKAGGMEYEYKIDARTGGVLTYEMDRD